MLSTFESARIAYPRADLWSRLSSGVYGLTAPRGPGVASLPFLIRSLPFWSGPFRFLDIGVATTQFRGVLLLPFAVRMRGAGNRLRGIVFTLLLIAAGLGAVSTLSG
jgi:hypothetical protein